MPLTRPPLSFLNSNSTVFTDPLLVLHQGSGSADSDVGFVFNRANGLVANVALYWSEADSTFYTTFTNSGGATDANLAPTTYANLVTNVLSANTVSVPSFTTTGNITGGNLITTGTVTLDRLSLSSSQTTVPPLQLTASSLQDGVGALRIDGSQADIFLNPATATHTTVTFAVNNDQRLAFGMDNNSDFYITRRTGGSWYDDTLVIDRDSGQVALGYNLLVSGDATVSGNLTINGTTTTVSSTNTLVSDSLMELNTGAGSNANDLGFIFERGSTGDNAAIIWDESADAFVMGTTTATGASTGDLTIANGELRLDTLRIDQSGSGLRMTNVGGFDNDGSDNFRIFATNDLKIAANGDSGTAITIDATNQDVTITNDLRVTAGQFYYGGTAVTSTATELNYLDGVTSAIQTQLDAKAPTASPTFTGDATFDTNTLFVDSSAGKVGIGNTSPASPLTVAGVIESTTGGVKFPDGTTQTTAASGGGVTEATAIEYAIALG